MQGDSAVSNPRFNMSLKKKGEMTNLSHPYAFFA